MKVLSGTPDGSDLDSRFFYIKNMKEQQIDDLLLFEVSLLKQNHFN